MKKLTLFAILAVCVCLLAACGSTKSTSIQPAITGSPTATVNEEQDKELVNIKTKFQDLNNHSYSILAEAQGNEACVAWQRYQQYVRLQDRIKDEAFSPDKTADMNFPETLRKAAGEVTNSSYEKMMAGKSISCGVGEGKISDAEMIKNIAMLLDTYGKPDGTGFTFDPKVFRAAYLRAIKPEVADALAELAKRPDSGDMQGLIASLIEDAQEWHITPSELGVPTETMKKIADYL